MPLATPSLPPTCNSLDASQRARLLKSARKLGDVLGATPQVLDADLFPSLPPSRNAMFLSPSAATSVTSFTESAESSPYNSPRRQQPPSQIPLIEAPPKKHSSRASKCATPLLLRLRSKSSLPNLDPAKARPETITIPSSFLSSVTVPNSPLFSPVSQDHVVPVTADDDDDKIRRKRMAKLTRTLGENVPPELVFSQDHQRTPSDSSSLSQWFGGRSKQPTNNEQCPPKMANNSTSRSSLKKNRRRSVSVSSPGIFKVTTTVVGGPLPLSLTLLPPAASTIPQYAGDPGWDGEWSIKDADKRATALRSLRSR